jgi:phage shock protein A
MESNETTTSESESHAVPRFTELKTLVAKMEADFEKFYKDGNKAAGTRVRNSMQELKTFAQAVRTEVQAIKNGGKPGEGGEGDDKDAGD